MATRRPSDLLNFSLPSPGTKETNEHHPHSEPGKFRSAAQIASSAESDLLTAPSVLRQMLKKNDYRMALVSGAGADYRGRPDPEQFSIPTGAVLWPFSWNELVLGVRESLRDSVPVAESSVVSFGDVYVNFAQMEVRRSLSGLVTLTRQEFKALACFVSNPGRVLSREELLNEAWGYNSYPTTRTVDNHVLRLRQKLEKDPAHPVHFQTVHRTGYKFVP
jgi:DNA-binding winged helix-turn-helix (wHTH) protein